jgi:hypothetical protein
VTTSAWAQVELAVRMLLGQYPTMPAAVMAQRVGWTGGHSWFSENVARIRPEYAPADRCDRLVHLPGEQVQCDLWFPGQLVPDRAGVLRSFPVLVMVAAYSRFIAAVMLPSRVTGDLLAGMWRVLCCSRTSVRFHELYCGTTSPEWDSADAWRRGWQDLRCVGYPTDPSPTI